MKPHFYEILPQYPSGRTVWVWPRIGRWWIHIEIYKWCLHLGTEAKKKPRLTPWQRRKS